MNCTTKFQLTETQEVDVAVANCNPLSQIDSGLMPLFGVSTFLGLTALIVVLVRQNVGLLQVPATQKVNATD